MRRAVLIAVESFQDAAIAPVPHAEADVARLAAALPALGVAVDDADILAGHAATKTRIESRLRKRFKELADDTLLIVYLGRTFAHDGDGYLAAADTAADEPGETAVPLHTLHRLRKAAQGACLLLAEGGRDGLSEDSPLYEPVEAAEWQAFAKLPQTGVLLACAADEYTYTLEAERAGVFAHALLAALADGRLRDGAGTLHLLAVKQFLDAEQPRFVRKAVSGMAQMTPQLCGDDALSLGQSSPATGAALGEHWQHLRQVVLRTELRERLKNLRGFTKAHRAPDRVNAYAEKFLATLVAPDIAEDLAAIHAGLREQFGTKRKDMETITSGDGRGTIRTPDFDYTIAARYDGEDASQVVWRREVTEIRRPDIVAGAAFQTVFGKRFGALAFEFHSAVDIEALIDGIEEQEPAGVRLDYPADSSSLELHFQGFAGQVRIARHGLEIQGRNLETAQALIAIFFEFQRLFNREIRMKALPFGKQD